MVTITCELPGPKIYYTFDGSTLMSSSTEYSQHFELSRGGKMKSIACSVEGKTQMKKDGGSENAQFYNYHYAHGLFYD